MSEKCYSFQQSLFFLVIMWRSVGDLIAAIRSQRSPKHDYPVMKAVVL